MRGQLPRVALRFLEGAGTDAGSSQQLLVCKKRANRPAERVVPSRNRPSRVRPDI